MTGPDALKLTVAAVVSIAAVTTDIRDRRIPNLFSAALLMIGVLSSGMSRGWSGIGDGLLGATVAFAVFLVPYLMGGMGGGDVKLMAGFGALVGAREVLPALLIVAMAGAVTALLFIAYRRFRGLEFCPAVPYAPAIVIGSLLVTVSQIGAK